MFKKIFFTLLISIVALNLCAQNRADRFKDYAEMKGKEVRFYNAISMSEFQGYYAYEIVKEKPTLLKDDYIYELLEGVDLIVGDIEVYKKNRFLEVWAANKKLYLILDKGFSYIDNMRSVVYWEEQWRILSKDCKYLKLNSKILDRYTNIQHLAELSKYIPVKWKTVGMPKKINEEVKFECSLVGDVAVFLTFTIEEFDRYKDDFINQEEFVAEKVEQEKKLAEEQKKQEQRDSIIDSSSVFEAWIKHTYDAENILEKHDIDYKDREKKLKFSVYGSYAKSDRFYKGFTLGEEIELPENVLVFKNPSDKVYLNRRGSLGENIRMGVAKENDMAYARFYLDSLEKATLEVMEKIYKTYKFYKKNKVFILSENYSFSDYKFGLEFKFFNCYSKDIKYINLRIVAFNQVGDVQKDDFGNFAKDVRCIGPFESGEVGVYDFNELFWDDNDIIKELRVVELKITFMDNSVISFSGKAKVDKLRLSNYTEEEILK